MGIGHTYVCYSKDTILIQIKLGDVDDSLPKGMPGTQSNPR